MCPHTGDGACSVPCWTLIWRRIISIPKGKQSMVKQSDREESSSEYFTMIYNTKLKIYWSWLSSFNLLNTWSAFSMPDEIFDGNFRMSSYKTNFKWPEKFNDLARGYFHYGLTGGSSRFEGITKWLPNYPICPGGDNLSLGLTGTCHPTF